MNCTYPFSLLRDVVFTFFFIALFIFIPQVEASEVPDWVRIGRVAGLSLERGEDSLAIEQAVVKLKNEGVSVVELDTSLSLFWNDAEFTQEVAFIQDVAVKIHEHGMKVIVYYPALEVITPNGETAPHSMGKDHPEWLQVGLDGKVNVFYGSKEDWVPAGAESAWVSPNSGYRHFFQNRCTKLVRDTEVDGIWIDVPLYLDTGSQWADINPGAKSAYTAWSAARGENGGLGNDVPAMPDFNDPVFRSWLKWRHDNLGEFIEEVRANLHSIDPDFVVGVETYPMDYLDTVWTGLDAAYMKRANNFFRIWELDSVSNAEAMKYATIEDFSNKIAMQKWARGLDGDMASWSFSYGFQGLDAGLTLAATVATRNVPFESQTPNMTNTADSQTRTRWYEFVRDNAEPLLQAKRSADVGIWFSSETREYQDMPAGAIYGMYLEETSPTSDPEWWAQFTGATLRMAPHLGGWRGAAHGLHQLGVPYQVVHTPGITAEKLKDLSMVWLPNVGCMSNEEAELLRQFVFDGGTLFATGSYLPALKDEMGGERNKSALDDIFGFSGQTSSTARMQEFGNGVAIYRPDIEGRDLFAGQGGSSPLAEEILGKVEQFIRIHSEEKIVADLPKGIFVDLSEVQNNKQHLYVVNYSGLQQPLKENVQQISMKFQAPQGYRVVSATIKTPDESGDNGNLIFAKVAKGVYEILFTIDQFSLITFNLEPLQVETPPNNKVTISDPVRRDAVEAGLQFILNKMRHSTAPVPVQYGIRTNLKDNDGPTDVYTGGWHVTAEHMGLFLRVTALLGDQQAFSEAYQFVRDILFSKGYNLIAWSMHKDKHTRFLQADELNNTPVQMAANAPLDDLRAIHGLLEGEYLLSDAAELGRQALGGLYWTTVTDRMRGKATEYPGYPGGLLGISWDWEDHDDATLDPPAVGTGLGRQGSDLIPIDYHDLETMAMAAMNDPRWQETIASTVDLLLASEIPGSPGFFYNSYDTSGKFSGDFEYQYPPGQPQGENLKTIQELWTILHLKRISLVEPWLLDGGRRTLASAAAQRGYDAFKGFYQQNGKRIPEYLTFQGDDVPANILQPDVENLINGEVRIYAQLARLAILFDDRSFASQVIDEKLLADRVTDTGDSRYGMFGLVTAGSDDAEAWNTLEALLTILLESKKQTTGANVPPVAANDSIDAAMNTIRRIRAVELLANDTDPDGDVLSVASVDPTSARGGTLSYSGGGYLYSPPAGFIGEDNFAYTITDGQGSSSGLVTVDVLEEGGGPTTIVVDGDLTDWPVDHTLYLDPKDITGAENPLDIREMHFHNDKEKMYLGYIVEQAVTFHEGFTLYLDTDGNSATGFGMWDIGADYLIQGTTIFSYSGNGTNWAWQYRGDGQLGVEGKSIELSFDRSWIGNPETVNFIFYGDNEAYGGSVNAVDYIPDNVDGSQQGKPSFFTYVTKDENQNQPPTATDASYTTGANTSLAIVLGGTDPDGDGLTFTISSQPTRGDLLGSPPNMTYTPYSGQIGTDTFTFSVSDGEFTDTGIITIEIQATNDIVVDGNLEDWAAIGSLGSGVDVPSGAGNSVDLLDLKMYHSNDHIYVAYVNEVDVVLNWGFSLYFDVDQKATTGYMLGDIGVDYCLQGRQLYQYTGTSGEWSWAHVTEVSAASQDKRAEIAIPRNLLSGLGTSFNYVFLGDSGAFGGSGLEAYPEGVVNGQPPFHLQYDLTTPPGGLIEVDGDLGDWKDIPDLATDGDDVSGSANRVDIQRILFTHDNDKFYLAYKNRMAIDFNWAYSLYIDIDQAQSTGFGVWELGAEFLLQGSNVYKYTGNGSEWQWSFVGTMIIGESGDSIEASFPQTMLDSPASMRLLFVGDNAAYGGTAIDLVPDNGDGAGTGPRYLNFSVN